MQNFRSLLFVVPCIFLLMGCHSPVHSTNLQDNSNQLIADYTKQDIQLILDDLGVEYASLPKISQDKNSFTLQYQIGQSTKCDNIAYFQEVKQKIYLTKIKTICWIANGDIGWQEKTFSVNSDSLLGNVQLTNLFNELQSVFFKD